MNAGLSYAASPPLALPLRWFLSVPVFGALAGGWLLWAGPAVMAGRWQPQALAYVHLLALGVLLSAMLGALIQLLPVLVGAPLRRAAPIAAGVQALLLPGIVLFAGGLGTGTAPLVRFGSALLLCALLVYAAAALPAWRRSPRSGESARTIGWAGLSFLIAAALGFTLAAGHGWAGVPLLRRLTDLHAGWALIGWVGLLVAAVAWQVVPMFSITAPYPLWLRTGLAPVSVAALGLASLDAGWPLP
ncbi:MAG TPA: permease, partial [Plasticicumulans sp.]|nr:permease [Plasticicumulans sp.]